VTETAVGALDVRTDQASDTGAIRKLREADLAEADLRQVVDSLDAHHGARQDLLDPYTQSSSVPDSLVGISLIRDGEVQVGSLTGGA